MGGKAARVDEAAKCFDWLPRLPACGLSDWSTSSGRGGVSRPGQWWKTVCRSADWHRKNGFGPVPGHQSDGRRTFGKSLFLNGQDDRSRDCAKLRRGDESGGSEVALAYH